MIKLIQKFYNLFFSKNRALTRRLQHLLGYVPANVFLFRLAFSHRSRTHTKNEIGHIDGNNERLEYLGDAILGTVVAEYLYRKYPDRDEGFLTKMRSKCVKRKSLNEIGDKMGLEEFIIHENGRLTRSMLGNAVEALVGAVYLDTNYKATKHFIIKHIIRQHLDIHALEDYDDNYKSQLLEWCQKNNKIIQYKLVSKTKSSNRDLFKIAVMVEGEQVSIGNDYNKKSAEQIASEKALYKLKVIEK